MLPIRRSTAAARGHLVRRRENHARCGRRVLGGNTFERSRPLRHEADAMLCSVLIAGAVSDLFKYLVRRERPNRTLVRRHDTRVPRLGNAWHSFPSGHATH